MEVILALKTSKFVPKDSPLQENCHGATRFLYRVNVEEVVMVRVVESFEESLHLSVCSACHCKQEDDSNVLRVDWLRERMRLH